MWSQCMCSFACYSLASCVVSSLVTHSRREMAQVEVAPPGRQSFLSSIKYPSARCLARLHSLSVNAPVIPSNASITSMKTGSLTKRSHRLLWIVEGAFTEKRSYCRPRMCSQSGMMDHELPSPSVHGNPSSFWLMPSPTKLMCPDMC